MRTLRDARFALRTLGRSPGFTVVVVLTLAIGIGASAAIFSVVRAVVLRPLEYAAPGQLVRITSELTGFGATDTGVAPAELADYQARGDLFSGVAGVMSFSANVTSAGVPERVELLQVSWNYFAVLGVPPAYGRTFTRADDTAGVANLAVVSHAFWQRRLNADPAAVGRTIVIDQDPIVVVGVMPRDFHHPGRSIQNDADVWSPNGFRAGASAASRRRRLQSCLARLQPGVTVEQAQARLLEYGTAVSAQYPAEYPANVGWRPRVVSLQEDVVSGVATPMFMLLSGAGLLLLVACVNVAHLVLARSSARRQELAVRRALGASGSQLMSQLAIESAMLAAAGGVLGVLVGSWTVRALVALAPGRVPRLDAVTLDPGAIVTAATLALIVTMVFGFGPALRPRRGGVFVALKDGGAGRSSDGRAARTRGLLVAVEVAMATVLLVGAGLLVRTVSGMLSIPVGFATGDLVTARLSLPRPNDAARAVYLDPARRASFYREALRRVEALPGVERAALSSQVPLGGFNPPLFIEIDGGEAAAARPVVHDFQISRGYFETLGIRILRGRGFTDVDRAGAEPVAIVGETAARTFWNGRDPIGGRVRFAPELPWMTVVGVAADVVSRRLTDRPQPILYRPLEQASDLSMALLVRARGGAAGLAEPLAREIRAVDADTPVYAVRTMTDIIDIAVAQRRFLMLVLVAFGAIATALALLGIYGVMAFSVAQRTREIGIRMAIGARQADVSWMVLRRGLSLTMLGVSAGLAASLALTRFIASQLFGVQPSDPLTIAAVLLLMIAAAAAAAYVPARRAARIDPIAALRTP
jgi:putative ABC transport system permease protein